jgi:hypothetical protein
VAVVGLLVLVLKAVVAVVADLLVTSLAVEAVVVQVKPQWLTHLLLAEHKEKHIYVA